nr:phage tail protein [Chromobacterium sp. ASV5]
MQDTLKPIASPDNLFHDGNPYTGELGTVVTSEWLNNAQSAIQSTQQEVLSVLKDSGQTPDPKRQDQLLQAVKKIAWNGSARPSTLAGYGITDAQPLNNNLTALASLNTAGLVVDTGPGAAVTRAIVAGQGVTVSNGDGKAGNPTVALANSGAAAGTYGMVTVDAMGRVTAGRQMQAADVPGLDWSKITSGTPTTLAGYGISDAVTAADLAGRGLFGRAANIGAGSCLDIRPNGLYHVSEKVADRPVNSNGMLLANFLSTEWGALTYYAWGGATFEARLEGGVWKSWRQMGDTNSVTAAAPPGKVSHFAMSAPPAGWVKCDGALLSRAAYPALFAVIGTTFGAGDGKTTFGVPDLRGEFVRGWDDGRGVDSGRTIGSSQADDFKSHTHQEDIRDLALGSTYLCGMTRTNGGNLAIGSTAAAGGAETRPRNVALLACIKI